MGKARIIFFLNLNALCFVTQGTLEEQINDLVAITYILVIIIISCAVVQMLMRVNQLSLISLYNNQAHNTLGLKNLKPCELPSQCLGSKWSGRQRVETAPCT
jgi:hypothetical protein